MKKRLGLLLVGFLALSMNLVYAGSLEDNYLKRINKDIDKIQPYVLGEKKLNNNQVERSYPKKITGYEKMVDKLRKKDGSGDRLQSKLDEFITLFEKAKNKTADLDQQALSLLTEADMAFAEPAYDFLSENFSGLTSGKFRYTTPFTQLSVDALIESLQGWPEAEVQVEKIVSKIEPVADNDAILNQLSEKSEKTIQLVNRYPMYKKQLDKLKSELPGALKTEINRMKDAIAVTKGETFKESYYNGFVGESEANKALRAANNIAKAAKALGMKEASEMNKHTQAAVDLYTKEKNAKAADVIDRNKPQDDAYSGADLDAMKMHAKKLFKDKVGLPVKRISVLSKQWKRLTRHRYQSGSWYKEVYSVARVTTYAELDEGYVGEFQGFLYMNEKDQLTDYEVASYNKGKDVPPSNKIHADKF